MQLEQRKQAEEDAALEAKLNAERQQLQEAYQREEEQRKAKAALEDMKAQEAVAEMKRREKELERQRVIVRSVSTVACCGCDFDMRSSL